MKDVDLGEPTSFLDHVFLIVFNENVKQAKILQTIAEICLKPKFLMEPRKNYRPELQGNLMQKVISSWSYDMKGHAKKCVERYCELANKTTEQWYKVITPCLDGRKWICWRIIHCLLTKCSKMLVFGTHWWTWYFVVREQICSCYHQVDQSM